jgi:tetratricopeptide (TPR) repeat protein
VGDLLCMNSGLGPRLEMRRGRRAVDLYEQGYALEATDPEAAAAAYRRALAGRPDLADAHNNLGRLVHEAGELAAAEGHYRLALCAAPEVALYWFNLGVVLEDQRRAAEAIACYERALALDPALADGHFNVARLLERLGAARGDDVVIHRAVRHLVRYRDLTRGLQHGLQR